MTLFKDSQVTDSQAFEPPVTDLAPEYHALRAWLSTQGLACDASKDVILPKASIRWLQSLHTSKGRQESGILLVEGEHALQEALAAGCQILLWFAETGVDVPLAGEGLLPLVRLCRNDMARLATTASPPTCLGLVQKPKMPLVVEVFKGFPSSLPVPSVLMPSVLMLDGLQDPGNVGTLIRSAVAFGVTAVITTASTVDCFSPKVIRSSAGLVFRLPVIRVDADLEGVLIQCPPWTRLWFTTSHDIAPDGRAVQRAHPGLWSADNSENPAWDALILGNEGAGLTTLHGGQDHLRTQWLQIPTAAACESLNVAVAGSILLALRYMANY